MYVYELVQPASINLAARHAFTACNTPDCTHTCIRLRHLHTKLSTPVLIAALGPMHTRCPIPVVFSFPSQAAESVVSCGINAVSWHRGGSIFALATELGQIRLQDRRMQLQQQPVASAQAHLKRSLLRKHQLPPQQQREGSLTEQSAPDCTCVAFDPCDEYRLASGGADDYVYVLDRRRLEQPLDQLRLHGGSVTSVRWSHQRPGMLLTAAADGLVVLWDAGNMRHATAAPACHLFARGSAAGKHQQSQQPVQLQQQHPQQQRRPKQLSETEEAMAVLNQPGVVWVFGGHFSGVSAAAMNPDRPWLVASASESDAAAPDATGRTVIMQRQNVMVWEVNRSGM